MRGIVMSRTHPKTQGQRQVAVRKAEWKETDKETHKQTDRRTDKHVHVQSHKSHRLRGRSIIKRWCKQVWLQ